MFLINCNKYFVKSFQSVLSLFLFALVGYTALAGFPGYNYGHGAGYLGAGYHGGPIYGHGGYGYGYPGYGYGKLVTVMPICNQITRTYTVKVKVCFV